MSRILQAVYGASLIIAFAFYAKAMGLSPEASFAISSAIVGIVWTSISGRRTSCTKGCAS